MSVFWESNIIGYILNRHHTIMLSLSVCCDYLLSSLVFVGSAVRQSIMYLDT